MELTAFTLPRLTALLIALLACGVLTAPGQMSAEQFRKILTDRAGFTSADLNALENGEAVVKMLQTDDKQEIAVCGVVRLRDLPAVSMADFRRSLTQKSNKEMAAGGSFSSPPVLDDLKNLELEERDFKEMKKCSVGNCDMNMSKAMIKKTQSDIDWNAPDYRSQATQFIRQLLLQYVLDYSTKGDKVLGEYSNRKATVDLAESHRALLEDSLFLKELAPDLFDYIKNYPALARPEIQSELAWSTVDFGLNPTITLTHAAAYSATHGNTDQHFVVAKQFYASRYLDSSLSITCLLRLFSGQTPETYLVFTDRSRSDALDGMFNGMARRVVANEAKEKVTSVLQSAELRLLGEARRRLEPDPSPANPTLVERARALAHSPFVVAILLISFGVGAYWFFRWRKQA